MSVELRHPEPRLPRKVIHRSPSESTRLHMGRRLVNLSIQEIASFTDAEALDFFVHARWGGWEYARCPACGSIGSHYFNKRSSRWNCACCSKSFSVTSSTVFASRKLKLRELLTMGLLFINGASGKPALEVKRDIDKTYNTAYTNLQKLRTAMRNGNNVGLLGGDLEIDGLHQSGRRAAERRGRPQVTLEMDDKTADAIVEGAGLTTKEKSKTRLRARRDPQYRAALPPARRIMVAVLKRSHRKGRGAIAVQVVSALVEDGSVAAHLERNTLLPGESTLNSDTSPAYAAVGHKFQDHRSVEHSKTLIGKKGENNNQAESLNARQKRAEQGIYLNLEPKYLMEYFTESGFREETRRMANGDKLKLLIYYSGAAGRAVDFVNFTHGHHRTTEPTVPKPLGAGASGPEKGNGPFRVKRGRLPR